MKKFRLVCSVGYLEEEEDYPPLPSGRSTVLAYDQDPLILMDQVEKRIPRKERHLFSWEYRNNILYLKKDSDTEEEYLMYTIEMEEQFPPR